MSTCLRTTATVAFVLVLFHAGAADAGCGCDKPPPPLAPIRPAFASPGGDVTLFAPGIVEGSAYDVRFGAAPEGLVSATAVRKRDFADGVYKPQLVVHAPALPPGPTSVSVRQGDTTILDVAASDFTMLQAPIPLSEADGSVIATCYQAAVGADGSVYFPFDISAIGRRTSFSGAARGYRLTFAAGDVAIYNSQGVLMQLLGPDAGPIFTIVDDQDSHGALRFGVALGEANAPLTITTVKPMGTLDFDPDPLAELATFQPLPALDHMRGMSGVGTGDHGSGGVMFGRGSTETAGREFAVVPISSVGLGIDGSRLDLSVDVRLVDTALVGSAGLGLFAGKGITFASVWTDGAGTLHGTLTAGAGGSGDGPTGTGATTSFRSEWLRVKMHLAVSTTTVTVTGGVYKIGSDGQHSEQRILDLGSATLPASAVQAGTVLAGFGGVVRNAASDDAIHFDNLTFDGDLNAVTSGGGDDDPGTGETPGVDQNVRSYRLSYERHEFLSYRVLHTADPGFAHDPTDPAWHLNGSRHIDHDHLVVAVRGHLDGVASPQAGATPSFDFHVTTTLADGLQAPTTRKILAGQCEQACTGAECGQSAPCAPLPESGCRVSMRPEASLAIEDPTGDQRDALVWRWSAGQATPAESLGDPLTTDSPALCLYDESGAVPQLVLTATVPAGATCSARRGTRPCWRGRGQPVGSRGYAYRNPAGMPGGIRRFDFRPGTDGQARITVRGGGAPLVLPGLPLGLPLRAQVQAPGGQCWEAVYSASDVVKRNDAGGFKARMR